MPSHVPAEPAACNLVVLRGALSSDPRPRTMPSGSVTTQLEVTTRGANGTCSVPVVVDGEVTVTDGDEVVVIGFVRRRFFRAGGFTQSRTEVVAERLLPTRRRTAIERALREAISSLDAAA